MKGATIDWRCWIDQCEVRFPLHLTGIASRCVCSCAASSAWSWSIGRDQSLPCQRIAVFVRAATERSVPSVGSTWNVESRIQTPLGWGRLRQLQWWGQGGWSTRWHAESLQQLRWGCRHGALRRCLGTMMQEHFAYQLPWRTVKTNIFECWSNIVANRPHKRADQIRAKPHEPKVGESFAESKQSSDLLFQTADAPARGVNIWMSCSVFWFGTANAPEAELSRMSTVL